MIAIEASRLSHFLRKVVEKNASNVEVNIGVGKCVAFVFKANPQKAWKREVIFCLFVLYATVFHNLPDFLAPAKKGGDLKDWSRLVSCWDEMAPCFQMLSHFPGNLGIILAICCAIHDVCMAPTRFRWWKFWQRKSTWKTRWMWLWANGCWVFQGFSPRALMVWGVGRRLVVFTDQV